MRQRRYAPFETAGIPTAGSSEMLDDPILFQTVAGLLSSWIHFDSFAATANRSKRFAKMAYVLAVLYHRMDSLEIDLLNADHNNLECEFQIQVPVVEFVVVPDNGSLNADEAAVLAVAGDYNGDSDAAQDDAEADNCSSNIDAAVAVAVAVHAVEVADAGDAVDSSNPLGFGGNS